MINVIKGKVGESIFMIIIVAPLVAIMKPSSNNSHRLETGGRQGRRHGNVKGRCACEIQFMKAQKGKKMSYLKGHLAAIKRLIL